MYKIFAELPFDACTVGVTRFNRRAARPLSSGSERQQQQILKQNYIEAKKQTSKWVCLIIP